MALYSCCFAATQTSISSRKSIRRQSPSPTSYTCTGHTKRSVLQLIATPRPVGVPGALPYQSKPAQSQPSGHAAAETESCSSPSELTQSDGVAPVTDFRYPTLRRWMPLGARHAGRYAPRTPRLAQRDTVHTIRAWCRQLAGSANSASKACRTAAREVALRPAVTQHRAHVSQR